MNLGVTLIDTFVVVAVRAALTYLTNDRFKALRCEMGEVQREIGELKGEFKADITRPDGDVARLETRLDSGIAAVRSGIVQLALAVGAGRSAAQG